MSLSGSVAETDCGCPETFIDIDGSGRDAAWRCKVGWEFWASASPCARSLRVR